MRKRAVFWVPPSEGPRLQREGLCKFSSCQPSSPACLCLTIALLQPREEHGQQSVRQSVTEAVEQRASGFARIAEDRRNTATVFFFFFGSEEAASAGVWTGRLRGRFPGREEEGGKQIAALLFGRQACCCWTKPSHSQVGDTSALTSEGRGESTIQKGQAGEGRVGRAKSGKSAAMKSS